MDQEAIVAEIIDNNPQRRMWQCSACAYESKWKNNLIKHQRTHTGERPFQCPQCHQRFTQFVHLRRHVESHHSGLGEIGSA
jgi:rubrerythrin